MDGNGDCDDDSTGTGTAPALHSLTDPVRGTGFRRLDMLALQNPLRTAQTANAGLACSPRGAFLEVTQERTREPPSVPRLPPHASPLASPMTVAFSKALPTAETTSAPVVPIGGAAPRAP